jgi:DNA repair protein RecO
MSLKREVHTKGVVVARRAAGEGSVRIKLYTEELGLISAVATSGREERSKLRPYLLVGTRGTFSLVKGKADWRLTGAVGAVNSYFECSTDTQRESSARVLALLRQFIHGEGADFELFTNLWEFLQTLPTLLGDDVRIAEYVVVLRMLAALGYVGKSDGVEEFLGAEYSAALLVNAKNKRSDLVRIINDGIGASGL